MTPSPLQFSTMYVSTDGKWCYVVPWVIYDIGLSNVSWKSLEDRLLSVCPSWSVSFYLNQQPTRFIAPQVYFLKFCCLDRKKHLHDVIQVLCELELIIQRVKVMTTPDDRVVDLFFITDCIFRRIVYQLRITVSSPKFGSLQQGTCALSPSIAEELFSCELSGKEIHSQALTLNFTKLKKASITIGNTLSQAHTLLQIHCVEQKGLLYDIMRISKDNDIQLIVAILGHLWSSEHPSKRARIELLLRQQKLLKRDVRDVLQVMNVVVHAAL
ncbi:hypothetical protein GIB67_039932 [Kingdonia uniflora]|uniref:ACT domain-containing protein ACR n=1 Tax=Kingdonia uniflora TaxID=39325 RepID=A0A7J7P3H4_9MAGN|nr:hypothetical protein GIB67_039932 [Kingdonia uniflora]